jgi:hypothetical protein
MTIDKIPAVAFQVEMVITQHHDDVTSSTRYTAKGYGKGHKAVDTERRSNDGSSYLICTNSQLQH